MSTNRVIKEALLSDLRDCQLVESSGIERPRSGIVESVFIDRYRTELRFQPSFRDEGCTA